MGPRHGADVEQLVAVACVKIEQWRSVSKSSCRESLSQDGNELNGRTDVVKAAWRQPLREVGGEQEAGDEGEEEVVTVTGQCVALAAASPAAQEDLTNYTDINPMS